LFGGFFFFLVFIVYVFAVLVWNVRAMIEYNNSKNIRSSFSIDRRKCTVITRWRIFAPTETHGRINGKKSIYNTRTRILFQKYLFYFFINWLSAGIYNWREMNTYFHTKLKIVYSRDDHRHCNVKRRLSSLLIRTLTNMYFRYRKFKSIF